MPINGTGLQSYERELLLTNWRLRNKCMWVGTSPLKEEWFDSGDKSLASGRCNNVLDAYGFGVNGVFE